jgi:hypothetical protein
MFDVTAEIRAAPESGTLRKAVSELSEPAAPYEVELLGQPFGEQVGTPFGAQSVSNALSIP